uniref:Nitrate regulatory gene2 protein n=1 Tax=Chenopodium quinoa TaxID=63459 RepID=A0A803LG47_CHEQI
MGCASSKLDDLPAVILCRERVDFLSQALHQRYAFAESHVAYIHSLKSVGDSLHRFFDSSAGIPPPSPVLDLPPQRKLAADDLPPTSAAPAIDSGHLSHSNSGSHLHFHTDSDDDDDDDSGSGSLHHHLHDSPPRNSILIDGPSEADAGGGVGGGYIPGGGGYIPGTGFNPYMYTNGGNGYNMQMNYMKKHVTPSVSYEQRPAPPQPPRGGGGYGGWNGGPPPPMGQTKQAPPPPPPPPPATSAWDFMNLFESIDNHYPSYTPSRDSREVREEEGIPDLEDEDNQHEVVKEVHGHQKFVDDRKGDLKRAEVEEVVGMSEGDGGLYRARPSASSPESTPVEYEVHMVEKKVVGEEGKSEQQGKGGGRPGGFKNVFEVVREIQVQFERAATSGGEIAKVLEVGKLRYQRKNAAYQVSTKMLNVITPSLPSSSKDEASLDLDEDVQLRSANLSATLQKLYLWEKKLFDEVKAEEKMRVSHDRKLAKLNHLVEKGAEPTKIESTRSVVRSLSTKIRIAIQIVDRISVKINKLRDEELWPQLNELILGLSRMWKAMLECHHSQCEVIDGARGLDAVAFPSNPTDTHLEASLQLEHDLLNWTYRFTEWIGAQKGYVRALNRWLLKCILNEPEETADGVAPFSPGRAGAPPIFVICNQWDQSLERISETSEKDLIDSMRVFAMIVLHFRERDRGELRQRMTANRDMERKVKNLEKEDIKMQKKMVLASGDPDGLSLSGNVVYQSDTSSKTSLQAGLRHVFEALDRFTTDSVKVYEELLQRTEEVLREHGNVS